MNGRGANLILVLCVAGYLMLPACHRPSESLQEQEPEAPPTEEITSSALKYPRGPESLAEMNPYGIHYFRDGVSVLLDNRAPVFDATPFGRKVLQLNEYLALPLSALPRWRKLTAEEVFAHSGFYLGSNNADDERLLHKLAKAAAEMGHPAAQVRLSYTYFHGLGVAKDPKQSVYWASQAEQNGHAHGTAFLAHLYRMGVGVKRDKAKAREYLVTAADKGDIWAQAALGDALLGFDDSWGFKRDYKSAGSWITKAATRPFIEGNEFDAAQKARSLNAMGLMYEYGRGVPKNETEALAFYYLAKSLDGDAKAYEQNIANRERNMSSSARQYSQMRAQELRSIYLEPAAAKASEPLPDQPRVGFGSGVFVTQEGHLLTAAHVVKNAVNVTARINEQPVEAEIIAVDYPNDVALLKVDAKVNAAPIRSSAGVELGHAVFTIGFPNMLLQGTEPKFTEGAISSTSGLRDDPRQFQVSVQVQPGNSGGALFDENGNVVGLVVAKLDDRTASKLTGSLPQNVNYAVKSSYALPLLESLKAELVAEHSRPWFGSNRDQVVSRAKRASVPLMVELEAASQ